MHFELYITGATRFDPDKLVSTWSSQEVWQLARIYGFSRRQIEKITADNGRNTRSVKAKDWYLIKK